MFRLGAFNHEKAPEEAIPVIVKTDGSFAALVIIRMHIIVLPTICRGLVLNTEAELSNHLISPNWWRHVADTCPVTQRATWRPALTRAGKMRFYILRANEVDTSTSSQQQHSV